MTPSRGLAPSWLPNPCACFCKFSVSSDIPAGISASKIWGCVSEAGIFKEFINVLA